MSSAPQMIRLNCLLHGDDPESVFTIEISQSENVYALKKLVKEETKHSLGAVDANRLKLFRVDLSGYGRLALDDFQRTILNAMLKASLQAVDTLSKIYPSESPLDDENLHIVVVHPSNAPFVALGTHLARVNKPYAQASDGDVNDDVGIFDADDVQAILKEVDYRIDFTLDSHPLVAAVSNVTDHFKAGFLKFVRDGQEEIPILQYLSEIDSPQNHTIPGTRCWPVRGGHLILMPSVGSWLTDVRNVDARLWSLARQLFEAVDFMHRHGVAHLGLKPKNILIPPEGERLFIIDFGKSVRIQGVDTMLCGVVGVARYLPEAKDDRSQYSALRADLWSCGKTLYKLCGRCRPSARRDALLQIAEALMDEDPEKRPMMSNVLERVEWLINQ